MASHVETLISRHRFRRLVVSYAEPFDHSLPVSNSNFGPYEWQIEFHNAGYYNTERCLIAANRVGKTRTAAAELAIHATGLYPSWWEGRRFPSPVDAWCAGESWSDVRDIMQDALIGPLGEEGTGWIPKSRIEKITFRQAGVSNVIDQVKIKHETGGLSTIQFKSYEQKRKGFQGKSLDICWPDEECPQDIYSEMMTRLLDRKGIMLLTFTPLLGPTDVVQHFLNPPVNGIYLKNVGWEDAPHLDVEERNRLWMSYPPHERDTRSKGTPMMGEGAVFPVADEDIMCDPFEFPEWYAVINGIDFGIDHPAAGAFCGLDRETDTFYVRDCYKKSNETMAYHVQAMKKCGEWIPVAWPHDGAQRRADKDMGFSTQAKMYRREGLNMMPKHAQYDDSDRGNFREPALMEMLEYMTTGRFKVFKTCSQWFEEKRLYHRKDNLVVDKKDDILSATRVAFVMRRYARTKPLPVHHLAPRRPILGPRRWKR